MNLQIALKKHAEKWGHIQVGCVTTTSFKVGRSLSIGQWELKNRTRAVNQGLVAQMM